MQYPVVETGDIKASTHNNYQNNFDRNELPTELSKSLETDIEKSKAVKDAFKFVWKNYKEKAMGHDNIGPLSGQHSDNWNSWGITLVDSLDTLLLMDLEDEFKDAMETVKKINYKKSQSKFTVFEIIIRHLGGLIAAYDLSKEEILLSHAKDLADNLLPAFDSPFGYPVRHFNYGEKVSENTQKINTLAEVGSLQLEFHRLSVITGDKRYADIAQKIIDNVESWELDIPGLYPLEFDITTNKPITKKISFGALGDSFYEYLIKRYILMGGSEPQYKEMYQSSIKSLKEKLLVKKGNDLFLTELDYNLKPNNEMDHLACFVPGMLMLSGVYLKEKEEYVIGKKLVKSCQMFYNQTATGLGPEKIGFDPKKDGVEGLDNIYRLRPETLESIYYAYKFTGDNEYREWAWRIFTAIERHCKGKYGYTEYKDVNSLGNDNQSDSMESYFLAETLKYLYLIFTPNTLDLSKYVFTTEAHPLLITQ
ncbi:seven-hairpin glycosidase [Neoconidiobolus thromboides FSU 785]|nr:seven-hairpin glycosidase [Neoconidiobolus thromboides FSU 785]